MWNLRTKLSLSHTLPILVLMPFLSYYLLYSLEVFFTDNLLRQLANEARLVREQSEHDPALVVNARLAQDFLRAIAQLTDARVMLLARDGTILASTRVADGPRLGQRHPDPSVARALAGESAQGVGSGYAAEVAYVVLPIERDGHVDGALRVSYEVNDLRAQFNRLQWLVLGGVALTAALGLTLGLALAATIVRPLWQVRDSAERIAAGSFQARVAVPGRDEVGALALSFNRMAERLEQAEHVRERQLASIVHELARPLTVIRAAVETLRDGVDDEMHETLMTSVGEELGHLERLVGTLQGLHKRVLHPIQLNLTAVAIDRLLKASAASYEPIATQRRIGLRVDTPQSLPTVRADEDQLLRVVTNLLDNALKFTPHGGTITIRAGTEEDNVWIQVADTGVGITREELGHVFEEFYSGESSPPEERGMGLGLAICREIITAHQGQIRVESEVGQGTRLTFSLPLG